MIDIEKTARTEAAAAFDAMGAAFNAMQAAFTAMGEAFRALQGEADEYAAAVSETITNEPDDGGMERGEKTRLEDCEMCWCNTCANIEKCIKKPPFHIIKSNTPFPCEGCYDGMRFMPIEAHAGKRPCDGYVKGEENNG